MFKKMSCYALALTSLCSASSYAATQFGDHLTLSGFGTVGLTSSDNDQDAFVRDGALKGANKDPSWVVDSKLGLQLNGVATDWLSATVQVLADQRYAGDVSAEVEWAFVKLTPLAGLNIRLGRIAPALFMVSDSRNVGYANIPVRMPNEVYSLAGLKRLKGGDISYRFAIAGTSLTLSVLAGESEYTNANNVIPTEHTRGFNAVWDTNFGTFRIGEVKTKNVVKDFPAAGMTTIDPYTFSGIGYQYDKGTWLVNAEYVKRRSDLAGQYVDSDGWYVLGGYRFGNVAPYAFVAETTLPANAYNTLNGEQSTYAIGMRWDVIAGADLKLQFESVDPKGTMGVSFTPVFSLTGLPVRDKTNVISLAADFVF